MFIACRIWIQNEKFTKMSTKELSIGPVFLEIALVSLR